MDMQTIWPNPETKNMIKLCLNEIKIPNPVTRIVINYLPEIRIMRNGLRLMEFESFQPHRYERFMYPNINDVDSSDSKFILLLKKLEIPYKIYNGYNTVRSDLIKSYEQLHSFVCKTDIIITGGENITLTLGGTTLRFAKSESLTINSLARMLDVLRKFSKKSIGVKYRFAIPNFVKYHTKKNCSIIIPFKVVTPYKKIIEKNDEVDTYPLLSTIL